MLARLGRWLRAAGYDTVIIESSKPDHLILAQAIKEKRYLITRDKHFLEIKEASEWVIWLESNEVGDCIKELNQKLKINWMIRPFSRCLICNQELEEADEAALDQVPPKVKQEFDQFRYCPSCQKTYWLGSHTKRMVKSLRSFTLDTDLHGKNNL